MNNLNINQTRFRALIETTEASWLSDFWDFKSTRPSFKPDAFEAQKEEGMTHYQVAAVDFWRSVWSGFTNAHIDLKSLARNDGQMRRAIATWIADPFWP